MPLSSSWMFPGYIKYICIYILYDHLLNRDTKFPFVCFILGKWQTYPLLRHLCILLDTTLQVCHEFGMCRILIAGTR
jgi:hypothetical protein